MKAAPRKVAILFRYGAGEHVDFLPALPAMVERLVQQGAEVHHFGFGGGPELPLGLKDQLKVHAGPFKVCRASGWDKHVKALLWLASLPWLGWKCSREGFDVVFVDETLPLSAPLLRLGYRGSLMFTIHDFFMEIYWGKNFWLRYPGRWVQKIDLSAWKKLDRIFTRVEAAKVHLQGKGVDANRISVVPDPVDLTLFSPLENQQVRKNFREAWGMKEEDLVMVHHGIMHPNKGNLRLIEAMVALREDFPQLKLLLIGDGPEMKDLREAVKALHLETCVILTGWLPGMKDIAVALQSADIGLVMRKGIPGDHFHVTSTLVHNLACGLPVLAARLDGIAEVLDGSRAGEMFDPACGESFQEKLTVLIEDPDRRKEMGAEARRLAERLFDPERIAAAYVEAMGK